MGEKYDIFNMAFKMAFMHWNIKSIVVPNIVFWLFLVGNFGSYSLFPFSYSWFL